MYTTITDPANYTTGLDSTEEIVTALRSVAALVRSEHTTEQVYGPLERGTLSQDTIIWDGKDFYRRDGRAQAAGGGGLAVATIVRFATDNGPAPEIGSRVVPLLGQGANRYHLAGSPATVIDTATVQEQTSGHWLAVPVRHDDGVRGYTSAWLELPPSDSDPVVVEEAPRNTTEPPSFGPEQSALDEAQARWERLWKGLQEEADSRGWEPRFRRFAAEHGWEGLNDNPITFEVHVEVTMRPSQMEGRTSPTASQLREFLRTELAPSYVRLVSWAAKEDD